MAAGEPGKTPVLPTRPLLLTHTSVDEPLCLRSEQSCPHNLYCRLRDFGSWPYLAMLVSLRPWYECVLQFLLIACLATTNASESSDYSPFVQFYLLQGTPSENTERSTTYTVIRISLFSSSVRCSYMCLRKFTSQFHVLGTRTTL